MAKFLDQNGLEYLWSKLKALIPTKTSDLTNDSGFLQSPNVPYCTCTTAAGTVAKAATLVRGTFTADDLVAGAQVIVKFSNANTATNPTLSVNGTTAKAIKRYGATAVGTSAAASWNSGEFILLIYDGTYWVIEGWINTTYSSMTESEITAGTGTSARLITPARLKAAIQKWGLPNDTVVPTKVSDLTNDSGFITASDVPSEVFVVTVTLTSLDGGTSDKSSSEILAAAQAGKLPVVKVSYQSVSMVAALTFVGTVSDDIVARFTYIDQNNDTSFPYAHFDIVGNLAFMTVKSNKFATTDYVDGSIPSIGVTPIVTSGTNIASITINGTTTQLYAPTGSGGGGGDVNVIETVKVNGTALTPDSNKAVDITVPTNTSDLTNDSGFLDTITVQDYITEQGTSGDWTYRKWHSGKKECWLQKTISSLAISTASGNLYRSGSQTFAYPSNFFTSAPVVTASAQSNVAIIAGLNTACSASQAAIYFATGASGSRNVEVHIYAFGS